MDYTSQGLVSVFPLNTSAFGVRADWFQTFATRFEHPAFLLLILFLVLSIGIAILKRFEDTDWDKKFWNLPVLISAVLFWPALVLSAKELVDVFNTFLIKNVFGINWTGFGFPTLQSPVDIVTLPIEGLTRLLPNLAYWIIYAFFLIYFFFYTVLGPLLLAKGMLTDEIDGILELSKEVLVLLLWQTTTVILVGFLMPDIVSGKPLPSRPESNFYFLSLILGIMIFFVPPLTRKFTTHVESAFIPLGLKWGGAMVGLSLAGRTAGAAIAGAGASETIFQNIRRFTEHAKRADDFRSRYEHRQRTQDLTERRDDLENHLHTELERGKRAEKDAENRENLNESLFEMSERAKKEMDGDR